MEKGRVREIHVLAHYRYYFNDNYHLDFVENDDSPRHHMYDVYFGFDNFSPMHCFSISLNYLLRFWEKMHEGDYNDLKVFDIIKLYVESLSWVKEYDEYQDFLKQIGDDYDYVNAEFPF